MKIYAYSKPNLCDIPDDCKGGNCYQSAVETLLDLGQSATLVHGIVTGQGSIEGIKYGHAWVEKNGVVYDNSNGNEIVIPKEAYYFIGNIHTTVRYSYREALEMLASTKVYGPWDSLFDDYL